MAAYKDIIGQKITKVTSNPGEPKTGQMWYNSTDGKLKGLGILEAWSSASPLTRASAGGYYGSIGTSTSSLALVGTPGNSSPLETEEWNGTGWSASDNMAPYPGIAGNMTPQGGASGTVTSALYSGGEQYTGNTENKAQEYNGSSWTAITNTPVKTGYNVGIGAASDTSMSVGGYDETYAFLTNTLNWNGSAWTAGGSLSTARWGASGGGTNTAAWFSGGKTGSYPGTSSTGTENYNGTAWSSGDSLNTARWLSGGTGPQTAAIVIGERPSPGTGRNGNTEVYNGTAWAETADLATARVQFKGTGGTSGGAFVGGGNTPPNVANTEEFNKSTNIITAAAWSAGATYPVALNQLGGSGTQTAGLCFGGNVGTPNPNGSNQTNEYDGATWTSGGNLNQSKNTGSRSGVGTQTATMCINFRNDGTSTPVTPIPPANFNYAALTNVEEYDGSSWTAGTATPDGEVEAGTCGTVSAALRFGGNPGNPPAGPATNSTIYWNDSSWTSLNNMSTARYGLAPAFQGTYNAALGFGGETPPPANVASTEEFDGTNWTAGGNLVSTAFRHSGSGTQTAALSFGGSPSIAQTEGYDGTAWSTRPSLANGRSFGGGAGSSTAALYMCGDTTTHVEEFTGETTAANITDFTTS